MRFRIAFKSQRDHHLVVVFENGKRGRINPAGYRHLKAGDTGRAIEGRRGMRFILDSIDG